MPTTAVAHTSSPLSGVERIAALDALRGVAVILMVQQHLGAWFWNIPWRNMDRLFHDHPIMLSFNALGGGAAPLFTLLAGAGTVFLLNRTHASDFLSMGRGLTLVLLGLGLNLAAPFWFSSGSWYILHLIGTGYLLTPLWRRLPTGALLLTELMFAFSTPLVQALWGTPEALSNARMGDMSHPGGFLRLALVEGHFPILPWMAMFIAGIIAGRWLVAGKARLIAVAGTVHLIAGATLATWGVWVDPAKGSWAERAFTLTARFYPCYLPLFLILCAVSLITTFLWAVPLRPAISRGNPLVSLGRTSLTILLVHVIVFKQVFQMVGAYKQLSTTLTAFSILSVIVVFGAVAHLWKRSGFRYGAEWLLRQTDKLTGKIAVVPDTEK